MDLRGALDAFIDAAAGVVIGELDQAATSHAETREQGAALRNAAAAKALLGSRLDEALTAIVGEVTRRSARRYESVRRHPRYSSDPLVNELDDAEATLGREIVAAQARSERMPTLALALALIRVEAITIAMGDTPVAGRAAPRAATGGPVQRRRAMTAADIPAELAQTIFAAARGDMAAAIDKLRELEPTATNAGGIVTKVKVALERGRANSARTLADKLRDAGVHEEVPPPADPEADDAPVSGPRSTRMPPAPAAPHGTGRMSAGIRPRARHPGAALNGNGVGR